MTKINTLQDYKKFFSFDSLADSILNNIKHDLFSSYNNHFLGLHLRHFLDTTSPSISYQTSICRLKKVTSTNLSKGKHPLNHVLDSLLYKTEQKKICINIFFQNKKITIDSDFFFNKKENKESIMICNLVVNFSRDKNKLDYNSNITEIHNFCNKLDIEINYSNCISIFHAL